MWEIPLFGFGFDFLSCNQPFPKLTIAVGHLKIQKNYGGKGKFFKTLWSCNCRPSQPGDVWSSWIGAETGFAEVRRGLTVKLCFNSRNKYVFRHIFVVSKMPKCKSEYLKLIFMYLFQMALWGEHQGAAAHDLAATARNRDTLPPVCRRHHHTWRSAESASFQRAPCGTNIRQLIPLYFSLHSLPPIVFAFSHFPNPGSYFFFYLVYKAVKRRRCVFAVQMKWPECTFVRQVFLVPLRDEGQHPH